MHSSSVLMSQPCHEDPLFWLCFWYGALPAPPPHPQVCLCDSCQAQEISGQRAPHHADLNRNVRWCSNCVQLPNGEKQLVSMISVNLIRGGWFQMRSWSAGAASGGPVCGHVLLTHVGDKSSPGSARARRHMRSHGAACVLCEKIFCFSAIYKACPPNMVTSAASFLSLLLICSSLYK